MKVNRLWRKLMKNKSQTATMSENVKICSHLQEVAA